MQTSESLANDMTSTQSIRSESAPPSAGRLCTSRAPAPSDSIQRRNSLLNGRIAWSSGSAASAATCELKWEARRLGDGSSDPVTTALSHAPDATLRKPYFSEPMPAQQTPPGLMMSHGG